MTSTDSPKIIAPQKGYQTKFTGSPADIVIGGSGGGVGKTFALLMDSIRGCGQYLNYGATIFRQSYPEITMQGGLWDTSKAIFPFVGGVPNESKHYWKFPETDSQIAFRYLSDENQLDDWGGAQIPYIGFDELTTFSKKMFIFMLSRNRLGLMQNIPGSNRPLMRPKMRATCNPDPDSWLAEFLAWWINQDTGYAIPERSGVIRYFIVDQDNFVWGDTREEVKAKAPHVFEKPEFAGVELRELIKSVTFIPGNIQENKELLSKNPAYIANLMAQDEATQMRLLHGNWKIRTDGTSLFDWTCLENMFSNVVPERPSDKYYITIDHARQGNDLCVIGTWKGWKLIRIDVLTKSDTNDILAVIKNLRFRYRPIPVSQIIVDQDGIGVKDALKCHLFQGNARQTDTRDSSNKRIFDAQGRPIKDLFDNKKAQCAYKLSEKINENLVFVDLANVHCDGHHVTNGLIKQQGQLYEVRKRIKDDLRVVKRENPTFEGRKKITSKEQQKNANGGLSPDFFDMMNLRAEFEFIKNPVYMTSN